MKNFNNQDQEVIIQMLEDEAVTIFYLIFSKLEPSNYVSEFTQIQNQLDGEEPTKLLDADYRVKILDKYGYNERMRIYKLKRLEEIERCFNELLTKNEEVSPHN